MGVGVERVVLERVVMEVVVMEVVAVERVVVETAAAVMEAAVMVRWGSHLWRSPLSAAAMSTGAWRPLTLILTLTLALTPTLSPTLTLTLTLTLPLTRRVATEALQPVAELHAEIDSLRREPMWKTAAQRLRPTRPPVPDQALMRPASARPSSGWPPALFWLAGMPYVTGLVFFI